MNYIEQFWRDAKYEDALAKLPMVARFRELPSDKWFIDALVGFDKSMSATWICTQDSFPLCQVYDPPAGFEIGEGWRLIDVVGNTPHENDQFYDPVINAWCFCNEYLRNGSYDKNAIVRRRIEQPKPKYVPFTWEDREQLQGKWIYREKEGRIVEEVVWRFDCRAFDIIAKDWVKEWKFMDTNEPVGKKVTQ